MSLHPIAEAVRSQGRNGDSMLVHMTPGEVAALQQMAEANGGSLSINPETGQPEAFFLAALLPALAGAAMPSIAAATGIAALANPITSSLLIGGLTGAITGDMKQGLMAGLGAYGGFGLGESLMGAAAGTGAQVAAQGAQAALDPALLNATSGFSQAAPAATQGIAQNVAQAGQNVFAPGGVDIGLGALQKAGMPPTPAGISVPPLPNSSAVQGALQQLGLPQGANLAQPLTQAAPMTTPTVTPVAAQVAPTAPPVPAATQMSPTVYGPELGAAAPTASRLDLMAQGAKNIYNTEGGIGQFAKDNMMNIAAAAAPMVMPSDKKEEESKKDTTQYYYPEFDPGQLSQEQIAAQYADRPGTTAERLYRQVSYGPRASREVTAAKGGQIPGYQYGGIPAMMPRGFEDLGRRAEALQAERAAARQQQGIIPTALGMAGMNPVLAAVAGAAASQNSNMPAVLAGLMGATQAPAPVVNMSTPYSGSGLNVASVPSGGDSGSSISSDGVMASDIGGSEAFSKGGLPAMSYKRGGLKEDSFIVPADVLAALGNGSNNAGLAALNNMLAKVGAPRAEKIDGPGDGMSDSIPTSIEGRQPARVAKDEAYVPTEAVRRLGGGDVKKGAKKLYNLMARVRKAAHGDDKQQRRVNPDRLARA